uniref:FkbM family methyltransferase n=1 Tax=Ignisphaera aggregans TaxID=334771 RepID=A0A7C5YSY5_9CREN
MFLLSRYIINRVFGLYSIIPFYRDFSIRFTDSQGLKYYAKIQDWWRFAKPFEPLTHKFLFEHARKSDVFLDVGAHIGIYTIRLGLRVSRIIALGPEPQNYNFIYRNILVNHLNDKVIALPVAASDKDSHAYLCVKTFSGDHTLEDSRNCKKRIKVITVRIDTLLKILNIEKVDIIKIDVEHHENKVINGMNGLLSNNPPRILVIETRKNNSDLQKLFIELGYKVVVLDSQNSSCNYGFYKMM